MRRSTFVEMQCSIAQSLERIGDWWTLLIVRDVALGLQRFDELVTDLGISRNLLTSRLTHLINHSILDREPYSQRPPRHRYVLTESGWDLVPIAMAIAAWGDRWATPEGGPPVHFIHDSCGERFTPQVACSCCGEPIDPAKVSYEPGPGARQGPGTQLVGSVLQ